MELAEVENYRSPSSDQVPFPYGFVPARRRNFRIRISVVRVSPARAVCDP